MATLLSTPLPIEDVDVEAARERELVLELEFAVRASFPERHPDIREELVLWTRASKLGWRCERVPAYLQQKQRAHPKHDRIVAELRLDTDLDLDAMVRLWQVSVRAAAKRLNVDRPAVRRARDSVQLTVPHEGLY